MYSGWLISNGSLKTPTFIEMIDQYKVAATNQGIKLQHFYNNEFIVSMEGGELVLKGIEVQKLPDFVLFLDKDMRLAFQLEQLGVPLFNSKHVIEICDDKAKTFQYLGGKGIPMPKTVIAPLMFYNVEEEEVYLNQVEQLLGYPMVVKECFGSFGEQVYLVSNREELIKKRQELLTTPHLYQQYITSSSGRDVRIYVVGQEIVATMLRKSETDFRANIHNGGMGISYTPPKAFGEIALRIRELLNADFLGIDLLFDENENPILCEVNSNAHIKGIQMCTGVNVGEKVITHIAKKLIENSIED